MEKYRASPHQRVCFGPGFLPSGSSKIAQRGVTSDPELPSLCVSVQLSERKVGGGAVIVLGCGFCHETARVPVACSVRGAGSGAKTPSC